MPRPKSKQDKKLADDARLLRAWKHWHAEQLEEALAGVHRNVLERMMAQLKDLKSARELVNAMAAEDWSTVDEDTKLIVLHQVNAAICKLRTELGQEPIDDPLPGQPDNAYRLIKNLFNRFPPHVGERAAASGKSEVETVESSNE
jgi:hypothetical protein